MYLGNLTEDQTIDFAFSTHSAAGAPITLAGSPVVKVYKGNSTTTETSTGVTLTVDFDGVTGLHQVRIDTSSDAFYATASDYSVVLTAGTVDGVSVAGSVLATFSIQNRYDNGVAGAVTSINAHTDTKTANLDAAVSTRLAAASYTAPANSDVAAIKAKTDNLPATPASQGDVTGAVTSINAHTDTKTANLDAAVSSRLASSSYTAPDNSSIAAIKAKTDALPTDPGSESAILAAIDDIPIITGTGSVLYTYGPVWDDVGSMMDGVEVVIYADANAVGPVKARSYTENGYAVMQLDPGTYYRRLNRAGYSFAPEIDSFEVSE